MTTCTGSGELYLYSGDPFQDIDTTFTVQRDQVLFFLMKSAPELAFSVQVNGNPASLTLIPTSAKYVYSLSTSPGDVITVTGSSPSGARAVQGYLAQDSDHSVFDIDTLTYLYKDEGSITTYLTSGSYSTLFLDKYTENGPGQGTDLRPLAVTMTGDSGTVLDEVYIQPYPVGTQGAVTENFLIPQDGFYTLQVDSQDSIYWPWVTCDIPPLKIPIETCTGSGDLFLYQGDPFQEIATEFDVNHDQLLIFARASATLTAKVNGVPKALTLEADITSPFAVRVWSLATAPGNTVSIDGTHPWGARGVQGYLSQDSSDPVYDVSTLNVVYDDQAQDVLHLVPGTYDYVIFDKYTKNLPTQGEDFRTLTVKVAADKTVYEQTFDHPAPFPAEGAVVDSYTIQEKGDYTFSVVTTDSVYWMLLECEDTPVCGDGEIYDGVEECELPKTEDNRYCKQSTESCKDGKLGTRDSYGDCDAECRCNSDPFRYRCVEGECGAECDSDSDCPAIACESYCIGRDYYEFQDALNYCEGDCSCTDNICSDPKIYYDDPRCTECQDDRDCDDLDKEYCVGSSIKKDEGVCRNYECEVETSFAKECDDGLYCNGVETCDLAQCVSGAPVDCSGYDIKEIGTCFNNPDSIDYTWDYQDGWTSECDERTDSCTTHTPDLKHECDVEKCDAECETDADCDRLPGGVCTGGCTCEYLCHDINITPGYKNSVDGIRITDESFVSILDDPAMLQSGEIYKIIFMTINEAQFVENPVEFEAYLKDGSDNPVYIWFPTSATLGIDGFVTRTLTLDTQFLDPGTYTIFVNSSIGPQECEYHDNFREREITLRECMADTDCDDGLYCNGAETCDMQTYSCVSGTPVECSGYDLLSIGRCDNDPDQNIYTWDHFVGFTSVCDEETDSCTEGKEILTHTCDTERCDAECDSDDDCADVPCESGCVGDDYYTYEDVVNDCVSCVCETGQCGEPKISHNDPRCTECQDDDDCSDLDKTYCTGSDVYEDNGVCEDFVCTTETTKIVECNDGLYCNGEETCADAACVGGSAVDCSGYDLDAIGACDNDPDSITLTWDYFAGFTSECDEETDSCTEGIEILTHTCDVDRCDAECDSNGDCDDTPCVDECVGDDWHEYEDVSNTCVGCECTENQCDAPTVYENDPRCTECQDDSDCSHLDKNYCNGAYTVTETGVCENYVCTIHKEEVDCEDGVYCNGKETCSAGSCIAGTPVDCSGYDLEAIGTCDNVPDDLLYTWDTFGGFTSVCDEATETCTEGTTVLTHECDIDKCDAECESDSDCPAIACESFCVGNDYHEYTDAENFCLDDCACTANTCSEPYIHYNDPRCTECQDDADCDDLNRDYCSGTEVMHDEGICVDYQCEAENTIITDCDDGLFCNGAESCSDAQCVFGNDVDCSAYDNEKIETCLNDPDANPWTRDYYAGFTSECDEEADACTDEEVSVTHVCKISCGADDECDGVAPGTGDCTVQCEYKPPYICQRDGLFGVSTSQGHEYVCKEDNTYYRCNADGSAYVHVNECSYYCSADLACDGVVPGSSLEACDITGYVFLEDACDMECHLYEDKCEDDYSGCTSAPECDELDPGTGKCSSTCGFKECESDSDCDDGDFCNGEETCNLETYSCQTGDDVECSSFDLEEVDSCDYQPDGISLTRDTADGFVSACDEDTDSCTVGSYTFNHECDYTCGAECLTDADCGKNDCDYLDGCYGDDWHDYDDAWNSCNGCKCDEGACVNPGISTNDPRCTECQIDADCDDGLGCNGGETCVNYQCQAGTPEDCSQNDLPPVDSCDFQPDGISYTRDTAEGFMSECIETGGCTTGSYVFNHECDVTCGAQCAADGDCDATECDVLDGCNGNDYYDYSDTANSCLGDCSCTENECTAPVISYNDERCTECQIDADCDDGKWCNGYETCEDYQCVSGTDVDCSSFDLNEINTCSNVPDGNIFTWDFAAGFTSVCNEANDMCTTGTYSYSHECSSSCGAECSTDADCGDKSCEDGCVDFRYHDCDDISLTCENCLCNSAYCLPLQQCEETGTDGDSDGYDSECGDCRDDDPSIHPEAAEICNYIDDDCDGDIDEGLVDEFWRISYTTRNTGEIVVLDGITYPANDRVDFFHGHVYKREGGYYEGFGSLAARAVDNSGKDVKINVKFDVTDMIEIDCEHVTWRNSARGTWWVEGIGIQDIDFDYMDITYHWNTGLIDAVGVGGIPFEFVDMVDYAS